MLRDAVSGRGGLRRVGGPATVAATASAEAEARAQYEAFFVRHHRELARLAFLLSGDGPSAEDLTAEALLAAWQKWSAIQEMDQPFAYVRRILVNMAASRVRRLEAERRRGVLLAAAERNVTSGSDPGVAVDVRAALLQLPVRRRACAVLRHAFDLSEAEVARVMGISVGTVKSQTFKAMAQLEEILGPSWREGDSRERSARRTEARR
jgi:RNA polymerase sigma-70 factor (sigma-E family)